MLIDKLHLKDYPPLSDPLNNTIPEDLPDTAFCKKFNYAERGPLTVDQLLEAHKIKPQRGGIQSM